MWVVSGVSNDMDGVHATKNQAEVAELQGFVSGGGVVKHCGFGERGEIIARELWSKLRREQTQRQQQLQQQLQQQQPEQQHQQQQHQPEQYQSSSGSPSSSSSQSGSIHSSNT